MGASATARVYIERYVDEPRHIEIQVLGDRHGNVIHLGERECSIQRRHQKVIEEAPSPVVDAGAARAHGRGGGARRRRRSATSTPAPSSSSLDADRSFYFLEMNTRLQVEHPVTEAVTGIDLVARADRGRRAAQPLRCEAVGRLAARPRDRVPDLRRGPLPQLPALAGPSPGSRLPRGPGIRNDSGVVTGYRVPLDYDPMLAKLITWGENREIAVARMKRALDEYRVDGISTSIPFFQAMLAHPRFVSADFDTHFIEEVFREGLAEDRDPDHEEVAFAIAALERFREAASARPIAGAAPAGDGSGVSTWRRAGRLSAASRWPR